METPQPDKTGMHILLKLASLVVILAGIHAAADIIVQLLLALFFAIVLNPLVTWFIRRGVQRPVAITIVVVVMLIALTALVGVLAASFNEFISMLPKFNKELTRKLFKLQEMLPFLNLHMSPERMLQRMDSEKVVTFTTALMTGLSGAMASVLLLVMTVVFMLFEVRHVPYKMRFALNNPQIHIAGLHRALKGVSHYLALKTLLSLWTGVIVWLGLELMGVQFALMWAVLAFLLNYVPNIGAVISGINDGANLATDVLYSGTVGAALEGFLHEIPALAVSRDVHSEIPFDDVADVATKFFAEKFSDEKNFFYNMNFPKKYRDDKPQLKISRLGRRDYVNVFKKITDEDGRNFYIVGGEIIDLDKSEGTDIFFADAGFVTVTPLDFDVVNRTLL